MDAVAKHKIDVDGHLNDKFRSHFGLRFKNDTADAASIEIEQPLVTSDEPSPERLHPEVLKPLAKPWRRMTTNIYLTQWAPRLARRQTIELPFAWSAAAEESTVSIDLADADASNNAALYARNNAAPQACLQLDRMTGRPPLAVTFDARSRPEPAGEQHIRCARRRRTARRRAAQCHDPRR
jgi:hypothetical protein